jgi:hypothetical protein
MTLTEGNTFSVDTAATDVAYVNATGDTMTGDLVVEGSVEVGNDAAACATGNAGAIRWNGMQLQYCNGTEWTSFSTSRVVLYDVGGADRNGNLGNRATTDGLCWSSASRPLGLAHYRALLSYSAADDIADMPTTFLVPSGVPIVSTTGAQIAADWNDLLDGSIGQSLQSAGVLSAGTAWWSGSNSDGKFDNTCGTGWNATTGSAVRGFAGSTTGTWIDNGNVACSQTHRLLCIAYTP